MNPACRSSFPRTVPVSLLRALAVMAIFLLAAGSSGLGACTTDAECGTGGTCVGGACQCAAGDVSCNGVCTDPSADPNNCGLCGHVCAAGSACVSGVCTCPAGDVVCGSTCSNLASDPNNCGGCGHACAAGSACVSGVCQASASCSDGVKDGTETGVDCGGGICPACGIGQGCLTGSDCQSQICSSGTCVSACPAGQVVCGGLCKDTASDPNNCGVCGHACAPGTACVSGVCAACTPNTCSGLGFTCGSASDGCGGTLNCGSCPSGQTCAGGACLSCTPSTCAGLGLSCGSASDGCGGMLSCGACPGGQACVSNVCVTCAPNTCSSHGFNCGTIPDGCGGTINCGTCAGGQICSGNVCATCTPSTCSGLGFTCGSASDGCGGTLNCGTCPAGSACVSGVCQSSGSCTDGMKDGTETGIDCGGGACPACGLGQGCLIGSDCQSQVCSGGTCVSACPTGDVNCGGVCTNPASDPANCGGCGHVCPAGDSCVSGVCQAPSSCSDGMKDGTETGVDCGGGVCPACGLGQGCLIGSDCQSLLCSGGTCVSACPTGDVSCGGVCTNPASDPGNCGACGHACPTGAACISGACACPTGTVSCGTTCTDPATDPGNCGGCGHVCAAGSACVGGVCACPAGDVVCGSSCTSLTSDPANCGLCGNVCTAGSSCVSGVCQSSVGASVCIGSTFGDPGQTLTVPITLSNGNGVAGFQVDIGFNDALLGFVAVHLGADTTAAGGWEINSASLGAGDQRVLGDSNPPAGLGAGPREVGLADFSIAATAPTGPISAFTLTNCVLSDARGIEIPCSICPAPGQVTVRPAASFSFQPIGSPVGVDQFDPLQFTAGVQAMTAGGDLATGYNGTAAMSVGPTCAGTLKPASLPFASGIGNQAFAIACCLDPLLPGTETSLSLQATDATFSITGSSLPFNGFAKGDVNADNAVNVLDVLRAVNLSLNQSVSGPPPLPFQQWAANMLDQNCAVDTAINVLDIVRIRNKALGRPPLCACSAGVAGVAARQSAAPAAPITISLKRAGSKDFLVHVTGAADLSGLQLEISAVGSNPRVSLEGLTAGRNWQAATASHQGTLRITAFSNGATGVSGDGVVLRITGGGHPRIKAAVASDSEGREIPVKTGWSR